MAELNVKLHFNQEMREFLRVAKNPPKNFLLVFMRELMQALLGRRSYAGTGITNNYIVGHFTYGNKERYRWKAHSPEYAKRRKPAPYLVQDGDLLAGALGSRVTISPKVSELETITPEYAAVHQFGGRYMPRRDFLAPSNEDQKKVGRIAEAILPKVLYGKVR